MGTAGHARTRAHTHNAQTLVRWFSGWGAEERCHAASKDHTSPKCMPRGMVSGPAGAPWQPSPLISTLGLRGGRRRGHGDPRSRLRNRFARSRATRTWGAPSIACKELRTLALRRFSDAPSRRSRLPTAASVSPRARKTAQSGSASLRIVRCWARGSEWVVRFRRCAEKVHVLNPHGNGFNPNFTLPSSEWAHEFSSPPTMRLHVASLAAWLLATLLSAPGPCAADELPVSPRAQLGGGRARFR